MKLGIKVRADSVEEMYNINEEESEEVMEFVGYAINKYKKVPRQVKYLYEKLGDDDRKLIYALSMLFYTHGYIDGRNSR